MKYAGKKKGQENNCGAVELENCRNNLEAPDGIGEPGNVFGKTLLQISFYFTKSLIRINQTEANSDSGAK